MTDPRKIAIDVLQSLLNYKDDEIVAHWDDILDRVRTLIDFLSADREKSLKNIKEIRDQNKTDTNKAVFGLVTIVAGIGCAFFTAGASLLVACKYLLRIII